MNKKFIYSLFALLLFATINKEQCAAQNRTSGTKKEVVLPTKNKGVKKQKKGIQLPDDSTKVSVSAPIRVAMEKVERPLPTAEEILSWVNFIKPAPQKMHVSSVTGSIPLDYSRGQKEKYDKKNNAEAMYKLQSSLRQLKADPNIIVTAIHITGYTSPDGDYRLNEKNGMRRALGLTDYIRTNRCLDAIPFDVNWVAEDWTHLTQMIETSDMPFKSSVLDIIRTVEVVDGRERTLVNLASGVPYGYISSYFFPQLRRIEYTIEYKVKKPQPGNTEQKINYADMSLNDFYNMAQSHEPGSDEFNDLTDLAGRLFPDEPVACINAAAVALYKKDMPRARKYLEKFATLPEAGNNMGVLYLLERNYDKAEVYLELAKAAGYNQAGLALEYLKKNKIKNSI